MANAIQKDALPKHCELEGCFKTLKLTDIKCKNCFKTFCLRHFLPESHNCPKLEEFKEKLRKQHEEKLNNEATIEHKIDKI